MKAMILAAGLGTRMGSMTTQSCKGLLELLGKPLIEFSLDNALNMRVDEIIIVISAKSEAIRMRYGNLYCGVPLRYVLQERPTGIVDAMTLGREALDGTDFVLLLADEILLNADHQGMRRAFFERDLGIVCGVMEPASPDQIRKNYDVITKPNRRVLRLMEKPSVPQGKLLGLGNCIFQNRMLDYVVSTPVDPIRKQKDLTGLIQAAVDSGELVEVYTLCTDYVNVNDLTEFARAEYLLGRTLQPG